MSTAEQQWHSIGPFSNPPRGWAKSEERNITRAAGLNQRDIPYHVMSHSAIKGGNRKKRGGVGSRLEDVGPPLEHRLRALRPCFKDVVNHRSFVGSRE